MHKSHKARQVGRAEYTHSWSGLSTFPIHWGSAKKPNKQTTNNQEKHSWVANG